MKPSIPDYLKPQLSEIEEQIKQAQSLAKQPDFAQLATKELEKLTIQKDSILQLAKQTAESANTQQQVQTSTKGALLEVRAAAGGEEAKLWAADLLRMYIRYLESKKWKYQAIGESSLRINNKAAYSQLEWESGVHRVQRIPDTEKSGRIHTSTATVAVLPILPPTQIELRWDDIKMDYFRSGGAGGQNVNKVNTGVRLTHEPSGFVAESTQKRTQYENKEIAEEMLRGMLWQQEEEKRLEKIEDKRSAAVGRGMRAEKIRTYNYPQNRVTDHRINKSWYALDTILDGDLDDIFTQLAQFDTSQEPTQ